MKEKRANLSNKLLAGTIIYAIGNFGTKILNFLIVPMYTYYISSKDMGMYDLVNSTLNMIFPLLTLQISDAAYRWLIRGGGDEYKRCAFHVIIINSVLFIIILNVASWFIKIPYYRYIPWVMITSAFLDVMQKMLRGINKQRLFALSGVLYTFVFLVLNVFQVCIIKKGVDSLFTSAIIANLVVILIILILEPNLRVNVWKTINLKLIAKMLKFSVPLVPNQLNWWIMSSSDRYIITIAMGVAAIFPVAGRMVRKRLPLRCTGGRIDRPKAGKASLPRSWALLYPGTQRHASGQPCQAMAATGFCGRRARRTGGAAGRADTGIGFVRCPRRKKQPAERSPAGMRYFNQQ